MPITVEEGFHDGDNSDRVEEVRARSYRPRSSNDVRADQDRFMALPQHKKLPQPAEGSTYT